MLILLKKETLLSNFYTCLISFKKKPSEMCSQNFNSGCLSSEALSLVFPAGMVGREGEGVS